MLILSMAVVGILLTCGLTAGMRHYAIESQLLDHPNARSSHSMPTPRGGGVAIVAAFIALASAMTWSAMLPTNFFFALIGSALAVAGVGFLDDRSHLPARWRFAAHASAAVWALWMLNGIPPVPILGFSVDLGWPGVMVATLYLIWLVNLYNFMDGIDGIAGIEAITVALSGALCWRAATGTPLWFVPVLFAACVAGFLIWNYPPAKIFMGDSGSGFVGIVFGIFSIWTAEQAQQVFWCWFILLGVFMVDATTTLIRRVRRGERFHEAHRSHAYQYASRKHSSHKRVSLAIGLINLLWLLPVAMLVALDKLDGIAGVSLAYAPLVWLSFRYKAGVSEAQEV